MKWLHDLVLMDAGTHSCSLHRSSNVSLLSFIVLHSNFLRFGVTVMSMSSVSWRRISRRGGDEVKELKPNGQYHLEPGLSGINTTHSGTKCDQRPNLCQHIYQYTPTSQRPSAYYSQPTACHSTFSVHGQHHGTNSTSSPQICASRPASATGGWHGHQKPGSV